MISLTEHGGRRTHFFGLLLSNRLARGQILSTEMPTFGGTRSDKDSSEILHFAQSVLFLEASLPVTSANVIIS